MIITLFKVLVVYLDIGNGGIFDYDVILASSIVGLDLLLDRLPASFSCSSNVVLKTGGCSCYS